MPIICTPRELMSRTDKIPKLLSPLISKPHRIASARALSARNSVVLAAYSGIKPISSKHTDWRFKTTFNETFGCYYEIWSNHKNDSLILNSAYLQIIEFDHEVLSLHCDPTEPSNSRSYKYKSGPHLHINHPTNNRVSNAHIALNLENFKTVISSLKSLEDSLSNAINMIKDEFLS